jgi:3,4-dihydroxy-9,10-secoandrosta-1,3,5(10)-triene-9,17-dione 4,5-dioxygenase
MAKIQSLAYIVAESTDVSRWKQFAEQMVGASTSPAPDGGLYVKIDERAFRIAVVKGAQDRYALSGWEATDEAGFKSAVDALRKANVAVEPGSAELKKARCVQDLVSFVDPSGNRHELSWGYNGPRSPFVSPIGVAGFKTGAMGMGHTVLPSLKFDASLELFKNVLGMGLSDIFNFKPAPDAPAMRIYFLHAAGGRHHSLALAEMPSPSGCVHMMLEVNSMTEVGLAHDRMQKQGVKLMATLGQHENDLMTSFYIMTPGNFAMEYGWGGRIVDPATYKTTETHQVSIWGHDFSVGFR